MIDRFRKHFNEQELNYWISKSDDKGPWLVSKKLSNQRGYSLIGDRFATKEDADAFVKACATHEFFNMYYGGDDDIELVVSNHPNLEYNYHVAWKATDDWCEIKCDNKNQADEIFHKKEVELYQADAVYDLIILADSLENLGLEQCLISTGNS